ncbi:SDR family NAD(P)-dependent oxidoreductase [Streptomyces sp. AV19]|uniref:SDR family NAD(P)-dependent oxidoreductase n=1 Tax=Streptomyces sp. AV19 TaxID=2793068 RepID=UPI0027DB91DF|nr:SDR family NAD(P)-dependent oxidoreductase [Streptomyces sp. AV19]
MVSSCEAVAVVGVACRLPGGLCTPEALWAALCEERSLVGPVPADRFDAARWTDPEPGRPGKAYATAGGFLPDVRGFDAGFFNVSPREARRMDPQQRLLLEMAVEALDGAGVAPSSLAGSDTAVYVGASSQAFAFLQGLDPRSANAYTMTGGAACNIANRVSHFLDLRGPSLAVDTACSSSLVALHHACEALRSGRSALALAAGVNVLLSPFEFVGFAKASMLSPTGRCRPFSAEADGYVRAEGGGVVVLKPLQAAVRDGDPVLGVVLGSGVNADGWTPGLAQPSAAAQEALLREVYEAAGVAPDELVYLEMHGTGTPVGDPVECRAVGRALGVRRGAGRPLPVGSVKGHLGHLEPASGMAGFLKALLVLRHGRVPANAGALPLSADIDFEGLRLVPAVRELTLDPLPGGRVVAGVNSFGFGGANAHVVLAAPAPRPAAGPPVGGRALPVVVSARTPAAVAEAARRMADRLDGCAPEEFYDVAYTACRRRGRHEERIAVLAGDPATAAARLRAVAAEDGARAGARVTGAARGAVAFVFSGNGSQWAGMAADLLAGDPVFGRAVREADEALRPWLGWSVAEELAAPEGRRRAGTTDVAQPLLFAVQVGVVAVLRDRGVAPAAVAGHSSGEMAAAWAAGALDLASAARVVVARSRAQASTAGNWGMAALGADVARARALLAPYDGRVEVAGVNSGRDVTVSGDRDALELLYERCGREGVPVRPLDLAYAFHSRAMDGLEEGLTASLEGLKPGRATVPYASATTGTVLDGPELDAGYWWHNLRRPVLFAPVVERLRELGCDVFVEIGPHPVLCGYLRRTAGGEPALVVPTLAREVPGPQALDRAVARLVAGGARHDPTVFFPRPGRVVELPAYPWQREEHWNGDVAAWAGGCGDGTVDHPLLGERAAVADPVWHGPFDPARVPWLAGHRVGGAVVMPASGLLEMMLAAGRRVLDSPVEITRVAVPAALVLPFDDGRRVEVQTALAADDGIVRIAARGEEDASWREHARGRLRRLHTPVPPPVDLDALLARAPGRRTPEEHYRSALRRGLDYGPAFRVLRALRVGEGEVVADYAGGDGPSDFEAHPALLDGALQAGSALLEEVTEDGVPFLPVAVDRVRAWRRMPAAGHIHVRSRELSAREALWDVTVLAPNGLTCLTLEGCRLRRFDQGGRARARLLTTVGRAAPPPGPAVSPCPLPSPGEVARACAQELRAERAAADRAGARRLRELTAHFGAAAVASLLGDGAAGVFGVDGLVAAGVLREHVPLLEALLGAARAEGLVEPVEGGWRVVRPAAPAERFRAAAGERPGLAVELGLLGSCGARLAEVLQGHRDGGELLGSEAHRHLLEELSTDGCLRGFVHRAARAALRRLVRDWPRDRPLRVLEVGAGSGGATAFLLPELPPERTRYVCADGSDALFPRLRKRFADHDVLEQRVLGLDRDPREQGWAEGDFDLVVAPHVLHTARDARRSLGHLALLLDDGGQLLLAEPHDPVSLALLSGLRPGFWDRRDDGVRTDGPLLSAGAWQRLLSAEGWREPVVLGDDDDPARCGGSVLLARRPGRPAPPPAPAAPGGTWVVAAEPEQEALAAAVAGRLAAAGATVRRAAPGTRPEHWSPLPDGVLLLLGGDGAGVLDREVRRTAVLRSLAVAAERLPDARPALWLVTPPTGALPRPERPLHPGTASAWGVARCLANEHPGVAVRRVSLESTGRADEDAARLAAELAAPDGEEDEILLTAAGRFVTRLREGADAPAGSPAPAFALRVREPGRAHRPEWVPAEVPRPGPGEVVVAVRCAALNYRDVLQAQGLMPLDVPGAEHRPGMECAGVVTAVGAGAGQLAPGDRVFAFGSGTLASHVAVPAATAGRIPDGMGFAEAATLPVVLLTVHHALGRVARLAPGETVLVHGGAGGVGLAALQYARRAGAKVIAGAGTPAKRELLRLLGVEHVVDSRSMAFAEHVRSLTGGRGVDVVLNSLAGEAIGRGLECLAPGGRFVELGKRDLYADNRLPLGPFLGNLTFGAVDLAHLARERPLVVAEEFAEVVRWVREGAYRPVPHRVYAAGRVAEAFEALRHSRHIGKLVVSLDAPPPLPGASGPVALDPRACYLVTGGLGGFGAATARRLAARGARRLCLVGRRGADGPEAPALLDELRGAGVEVTAHAADVADGAAMAALLDEVDTPEHPLRGVVHAATVLDDGPLTGITDASARRVLSPKAEGARVLDRLTRRRRLDFFVLYGSASALLGNPGQATYAGANLALEAVARARRAAGLPALTVAWGALGGAGHVARHGLDGVMEKVGLPPVPAGRALDFLDGLLAGDGDVAVVAGIGWDRLRHAVGSVAAARFAPARPESDGAADRQARDLARALADAGPEEALALVTEAVTALLERVLQAAPGRVRAEDRLDRLGLDSLMGAELMTALHQRLGCDVPAVEILGSTTVTDLARRCLRRLSVPSGNGDGDGDGDGDAATGRADGRPSAPPAAVPAPG